MQRENQDFIRRLLKRRPELEPQIRGQLRADRLLTGGLEGTEAGLDAALRGASPASLETIVSEQRPVFFAAQDDAGRPAVDREAVTLRGTEAKFLADQIAAHEAVVAPLLARVGRIDVEGLAGLPYVGTGWIIDDGIVVTNRHVAEVIARRSGQQYQFRMGAYGRPISVSFGTGHLKVETGPALSIPVAGVLYIEPERSGVDIAFLQLSVQSQAPALAPLAILSGSVSEAQPLCALGYPARAPADVIPDQALMQDLYRGVYDVKRLAPGFVARQEADLITHDCTTLGGNSGSAVVVLETGEVAGLHFAGVYRRENQAVPARILADYRARRRWLRPPAVETASAPVPQAAAVPGAATTITITVTIQGGGASVTVGGGAPRTAAEVEAAAAAFLRAQGGVLAARVGYGEGSSEEDAAPRIVAAVPQSRLADTASWPAAFRGIPVRYEAATLMEQIDDLATEEAVSGIAYDDDARTGPEFALEPVTEEMTVRPHLSPEYGFAQFQSFLESAASPLVCAMYEFQGLPLAEAMEGALARGTEIALTIDRRSDAPKHGAPADGGDPLTFQVGREFERWASDYHFHYKVVPIGRRGLVASDYHIKVTVSADDHVWLSSGNWKNASSLPPVTDAMRREAADTDLPGNREWHVIVSSPTLAQRLRNHIQQDSRRSGDLTGATESVTADRFVLVPVDEAVPVAERRPPSRILAPLEVSGRIRAQALLTPDKDGRVFTDAVLDLIRSARSTLLFQIPYIGMRPDPSVHRGNIDELIDALVDKLLTLDDARVILRTGNDRFSDNRHVAWYFRSKGVDIDNRLRAMDNHHTKGMVVDGARVLVGSHNWSGLGTRLNRDASLIFHERRCAGYFAEAFNIDWARANKVAPKRYVQRMPEIVAFGPEAPLPAGYALRPLGDVLADSDD